MAKDSGGIQIAVYLLIVAAILSVATWWQLYKYHDCIRVGHSKTYCILDMGK